MALYREHAPLLAEAHLLLASSAYARKDKEVALTYRSLNKAIIALEEAILSKAPTTRLDETLRVRMESLRVALVSIRPSP